MHTNDFYIKTINLQNYKKYDSLELHFKNRFTLVIGENGSGKTSVLDAIATLLRILTSI
ncbi:MAG: AAA family ATPase [Sulfurovum sp.]|nr:AAA family ATPase [Sulfurovum sp.]